MCIRCMRKVRFRFYPCRASSLMEKLAVFKLSWNRWKITTVKILWACIIKRIDIIWRQEKLLWVRLEISSDGRLHIEPWLHLHLFAAWPSLSLASQRDEDNCSEMSPWGRHTPFPLPQCFYCWWKFKAKILEEYRCSCFLLNFTIIVRFESSVYIWYFPYI